MASAQTSFDSILRRLDENQTRHDEHQRSFKEHQRSLEELKDMMRTLLVMEGMHSPSEEHQDRVDPAPSTNWILNGANREEQRKRLEDHHSYLEENRVCMEPMQKITEHRFEFSIDAVENLFKDRDQDRSEVVGGVNLGVQSSAFEANSTPVMPIRSRLSEARPLVPERIVPDSFSTETTSMVTKQTEGNSRLKLVDWHFHVLDDSLGVENLELHPLRVDDLVGSKAFEFMMNAQEVFDKLPEKECDDVNDSIDFLGLLGDSYGSSSFVFDPGKKIEFEATYEEMGKLVVNHVKPIDIGLSDVQKSSFEIFGLVSAHKVFDRMSKRKTEATSIPFSSTVVYVGIKIVLDDSCLIVVDNMVLVFDPGGVVNHGRLRVDSSFAVGLVLIWRKLVWVFDLGPYLN